MNIGAGGAGMGQARAQVLRHSLAAELQAYEDLLSGRGTKNYLLCQMCSKLVYMVPVYVSLSVARTVRTQGLGDFLNCLCGLLAQYSGGTATLFLAFRRKQMAQFIGHVRVLAEQFDAQNGPAHREVTERTASWIRWVRSIAATWVQTGACLIMLQVTLSKPPLPTIPDLSDGPFWPITAILEFVKWVFCGGSFITLWMLVVASATSVVGMYRSLVNRAARAVGFEAVLVVLLQHQQLCRVEEEMNSLLYRFLLHYMFAVGVVPLVNTIQMLQGSANLLSIMTFSTLPVTIGTFSLLGDKLTASSESLAETVYSGSWMQEGLEARKIRRLIMARALRPLEPHRGSLAIIGFGSFSLVSALAYLRTWYSYLQLLIKASRKWS